MKKLQKNLILCLILALSLMLPTALARGSTPGDLSGTWTGRDMGGGIEAVLTLEGKEEATLQLSMDGKSDTGLLRFDAQGRAFSALFPQRNQMGVKSCSGVVMPMGDSLTLSLTIQRSDGSMIMPLMILKRTEETQGDQGKPGATRDFAVPQWGIDLQVPPSLSEAMMEDPPEGMNPFSFRKDTLPEGTTFNVAGWLKSPSGISDALALNAYCTPPEAKAGEEASMEKAIRTFMVLSRAEEGGMRVTASGRLVSTQDLTATAFPIELRQGEKTLIQCWVFLLPFGENTLAVIGATPTPDQTDTRQMILDVLATLRVE